MLDNGFKLDFKSGPFKEYFDGKLKSGLVGVMGERNTQTNYLRSYRQ